MKSIKNFFISIVDLLETSLYYFCYTLSTGFFFYLYLIASLLSKIFPLKFLVDLKYFFQRKQKDTLAFLSVVFVLFVSIFVYTQFNTRMNVLQHVDKDKITDKVQKKKIIKDSYDFNLYRKYAKYDINTIDIKSLKKDNNDIVAWLMVDGTNINYPIVQTNDNDYYLKHDIKKNVKSSGWTFMDYRNDKELLDDNTIFYGHNLTNKTAFGSLANIFKKDWFQDSNHYIAVVTEEHKYVYEIFSAYIIDPEVYYLQNNFESEEDLNTFFNILKNRSQFNFHINVSGKDKIITLSTCTENNKQRRVVHAKLIKK